MSRLIRMVMAAIVLMVVGAVATSCKTGASAQPDPGGIQPGATQTKAQFPSLADLPRETTEIGGSTRLGREFSPAIPRNRVTAAGDQAQYLPVGQEVLQNMAYAGYLFDLSGATGAQTFQFDWETPPVVDPDDPRYWVGLADWDAMSWRWFAPADTAGWTIDDISSFIQPATGNCYVILLTSGTGLAVLDEFGFPDIQPPGPVVVSVDPLAGLSGADATFTAEDECPNPFDITWDFGGGAEPNTSTDLSPTVTLGTAGTYNCNVSVTNADGSDSFGFTLVISDPGPEVISVDPLEGQSGAEVTFSSVINCPNPYDVTWDFGGGAAPNVSTDPAPVVTLGTPGTYSSYLIAENTDGTDIFYFSLEVNDPGPSVVSVQPLGGYPGSEVTFSPVYSSFQSFDASWDFGGGATPNTSDERLPTVTLGAIGTYSCNVSVSNEHGSDSFDFTLHVRDKLYFACGKLGDKWWPEGYEDVHLTGTAEMTVESDADGFFVFPLLPNGTYTATPEREGYVPDHIDFTINDNFQTELNFQLWDGQPTHGIVGSIADPAVGELMFLDVQLTGDAERFSNQSISFADLADGDYVVTPVSPGYNYYPPSREVTIYKLNVHGCNFWATTEVLETYTVNGTVTDTVTGLPAVGVCLELLDGFNRFAVTDAAGYYEFTDVPAVPAHTWRVLPTVGEPAAAFVPAFGHFISGAGDATGCDFDMTAAE